MSRQHIRLIAHWTFSELFRTWGGWVSVMGFAFLNALTLSLMLWESSNPLLAGQGIELHRVLLPKFFATMNLFLLILLPAFTMYSISGEQVSHRLRLYQTAPISSLTVILGKTLGLCFLLDVLLMSTFPFIGFLGFMTELDWMRWVLGYLATCLQGVFLIAIGIWASSRTRRPLTAWFLSITLALFLWFLGTAQDFTWFQALSPLPKIQEYLDGWIGILDTFYFISTISFLLYHAQVALSSKRDVRPRSWEQRLTPVLWWIVLMLSNALVERYDRYWDINNTRPTLTENTLRMLSQMDQPINILVDLDPEDPRTRQMELYLRSLTPFPVQITWLNNQTRPPLQERGVYLQQASTESPVHLQHLSPSDVESGLRRLLFPTIQHLCFSQNGGEPSLFDGTSTEGFGLLTEALIALNYKVHIIDPLKPIDSPCNVFILAGRITPFSEDWLHEHIDSTPTIALIDPTTSIFPEAWLTQWGLKLQDDFLIEIHPQFQIHENPTTLSLNQSALSPHPKLNLQNQSLLLQNIRSISSLSSNTVSLGVELLHSSPQSWAETHYTIDNPTPDDADIVGHVPILVEISSLASGTPTPHLLFMGTSSLIENTWIQQNPANAHFFIQMLQHLLQDESPTSVAKPDTTIRMTTDTLQTYALFSIFGLPSFIGLCALVQKRRKVV